MIVGKKKDSLPSPGGWASDCPVLASISCCCLSLRLVHGSKRLSWCPSVSLESCMHGGRLGWAMWRDWARRGEPSVRYNNLIVPGLFSSRPPESQRSANKVSQVAVALFVYLDWILDVFSPSSVLSHLCMMVGSDGRIGHDFFQFNRILFRSFSVGCTESLLRVFPRETMRTIDFQSVVICHCAFSCS